ncbi:DEAD/DEAH box helicase [Robiginitalea sp. IMCC44478]|uniref:DEAD/DEAH box helicase n=1 Tax=Robiginitalea sp. IMCC44478 TaxID=3459122 RepID=UPI004041B329
MSSYKKTPQGIFEYSKEIKEWIPYRVIDSINDSEISEISIENYLSEQKDFLMDFINTHRRIQLNASPGSGKTTFFADLCAEHLKNKKPGRILFCAPFLIIQKQFDQRLNSKGLSIDFELNGQTRRKTLLDTDVIITSTFKSIHHIKDQISEDDLVIIDEAHSLLFHYSNKVNRKDFFFEMMKFLFKTKAKIVLMTGTPHSGINSFLNLKELKVIKDDLKSNINIQYSSENENLIVLEFAKRSLEEYGPNHLHIIYIKNRRKCEEFRELIKINFNSKAFVLTSESKQSKVYQKLVNESLIPQDIEFLITTNVISTGANILNGNVGNALMLNEYNPIEIKQFSKRFRKKMDLRVDVVNRVPSFEMDLVKRRINLVDKRGKQRNYFKALIESIITLTQNSLSFLSFDPDFYDINHGSPDELIDKIIERSLIQEVYYTDKINETYNSSASLAKVLNNYHDVISVNASYYEELKLDDAHINLNIEKDRNNWLVEVTNDFMIKQLEYLKAIEYYLAHSNNYYLLSQFKRHLYFGKLRDVELDKTLLQKIQNPLFIKEVLIPLMDYEEFTKSRGKTLYIIQKVAKNKRNRLKLAFYINQEFNRFFKVSGPANGNPPTIKIKRDLIREVFSKREKLVQFLIKSTFKYCTNNDFINYEDLENYLIHRLKNYRIKETENEVFPLDQLMIDPENKIVRISNAFLYGLVNGLFYMKSGYKNRTHNGRRKSSYLFESSLPPKIETKNKVLKRDLNAIHATTKILKWDGVSMKFEVMDLNTNTRIINNNTLLQHTIVDENYYEIVSELNV